MRFGKIFNYILVVLTLAGVTLMIPEVEAMPDTDSNLNTLISSPAVQYCQQGDSNQPTVAWRCFYALLKEGRSGRRAALKLLSSPHSGARIYGAVLLQQIDRAEGTAKLKSMSTDQSEVLYAKSCVRTSTTVGALVARLLAGEEIILLHDPLAK